MYSAPNNATTLAHPLHSLIHYHKDIRHYTARHCRCSVLRQVNGILQSKFSSECDPVLPLSIYSILLFPQVHSIAAYVSFVLFPPLYPSLYLSFSYMLKAVPAQDVTISIILPCIVYMTFLSYLTLFNTPFFTRSIQLISILLQHHISKLSRHF